VKREGFERQVELAYAASASAHALDASWMEDNLAR
jgi:hypothetical protein